MRLRMIKPLRGWREFAGEVGIIVLGVIIALGAQQLAQEVTNRTAAKQARSAIRSELQVNMARLASRAAIRPCVERRLAEIQALLDKTGQGGEFATPQWVGRPQYWTMQTARWDALAQAGRAALLGDDELAQYSQLYHWMRNISSEMQVEQSDWAKLRTLEHLAEASPDALFELNAALQDARYRHWRIGQHSALLMPIARRAGLEQVPNDIPAPRSVCISMDTPRAQAVRESGSPYGEP